MLKGLQKKFLLLILVLNIIPLLFQGIFTAQYSYKTVMENNKKIANQDLDKMAEIHAKKITEYVNLISYIREDKTIKAYLQNPEKSSTVENRIELSTFMQNSVINYAVNYPYEYIFVNKNNEIFTNQPYMSDIRTRTISNHLEDAPWADSISNPYNRNVWIGVIPKMTANNYRAPYIYLSANIVDNSSYIGYVSIGFNTQYLWKNLVQTKLTENTDVFILDDSQNCIYESPDNTQLYSNIPSDVFDLIGSQTVHSFDQKTELILSSPITITGLNTSWKLLSLTPINDLRYSVYRPLRISIFLLLITVLGVGIIVLLMHSWIFRPLLTLQNGMKTIVDGNFNVKLSPTGIDEIADLFSGFQFMQQQLKKKIELIREKEQEKNRIEVQMLQAQINPHFICNSLNTIRIMADLNEDKAVSKALQALNHLVSHYLHNDTSMIPLEDEICHLKEYLYLQKLRYHNSFSYTIKVNQNIHHVGIMKLLLQPLVENCIVHGFSDRTLQGIITITVEITDNTLFITTHDNGCGISPEKLATILDEKKQDNSLGKKIGIINVQKRIQACFGESYGITIASTNGTTVLLRLPVIFLEQPSGLDKVKGE